VVLAAGSTSSSQATAVANLKAGGVLVSALLMPKVHAKALVVDGSRAYVGSENFTEPSLGHNRELGLIMTQATAVAPVAQNVSADFTAASPL
jgi:phosphatidylserine/phosphatidylglycerophosphate/cardiolipin synthase-like enzyme